MAAVEPAATMVLALGIEKPSAPSAPPPRPENSAVVFMMLQLSSACYTTAAAASQAPPNSTRASPRQVIYAASAAFGRKATPGVKVLLGTPTGKGVQSPMCWVVVW
mmetsp:Transcript_2370/g.6305  ORF Transcript_2370/g.6305 Transcript_2370/m.6305 type:complete len:106 (+) Transcript_2370:1733-2050(+)